MNEIFVSNAFADSASETSAKVFNSSFFIRNSSLERSGISKQASKQASKQGLSF